MNPEAQSREQRAAGAAGGARGRSGRKVLKASALKHTCHDTKMRGPQGYFMKPDGLVVTKIRSSINLKKPKSPNGGNILCVWLVAGGNGPAWRQDKIILLQRMMHEALPTSLPPQ